MTRVGELRVEWLETRQLLSGAHHVEPHVKHPVAGSALVINGTLAVDNNAASVTMDAEGDTITSTPVAGQLGALGEVHGVWTTSDDEYGDYMGPDTLKVHDPSGTFVVQFNESAGHARRIGGGAVQYSDPQLAADGTSAYAGSRESGTIELTTNAARSSVTTLTLVSQGK